MTISETKYRKKKCNKFDMAIRRLYMKTHGFIRDEGVLGLRAWNRITNMDSTDPKDMIIETTLALLTWKEIIKRYGKK